jgi:hypothetical protein
LFEQADGDDRPIGRRFFAGSGEWQVWGRAGGDDPAVVFRRAASMTS